MYCVVYVVGVIVHSADDAADFVPVGGVILHPHNGSYWFGVRFGDPIC